MVHREAERVLIKMTTEEETYGNNAASVVSGSSGSTSSRAVKLPKLQLPKFSEEVTAFKEFWDQFKAAINESDLPTVCHKVYIPQKSSGW